MTAPLVVLTTAAHTDEVRSLIDYAGEAARDLLVLLPYERIQARVSPAHYVFADLERLGDGHRRVATALHRAIEERNAAHPEARLQLLNHPTLSLSRAELGRRLHEEGINPQRVHRLWDRGDIRFPVFVRHESDHNGALSPVLPDRASLDAAIERIVAVRGYARERLLVVEHLDVRSPDGLYRKYSAMRIGDALFPVHVQVGSNWVTKDFDLVDARTVAEEERFIEEFPHRDLIERVFGLARIEYGRIDYGLVDGRPCVWEINTNPLFVAADQGSQLRDHVRRRYIERCVAALRRLREQ